MTVEKEPSEKKDAEATADTKPGAKKPFVSKFQRNGAFPTQQNQPGGGVQGSRRVMRRGGNRGR